MAVSIISVTFCWWWKITRDPWERK